MLLQHTMLIYLTSIFDGSTLVFTLMLVTFSKVFILGKNMYSLEQRKRAIKLYIKYGLKAAKFAPKAGAYAARAKAAKDKNCKKKK